MLIFVDANLAKSANYFTNIFSACAVSVISSTYPDKSFIWLTDVDVG